MKLLSLSLDPIILNPQSVVALRNARYGEVLERYAIIVPSVQKETVVLSSNVTVYGTGGSNKVSQLLRLCLRAWVLLRKERFDVITSQDTYFLALSGYFLSRFFHTGLEVQVLGIEKLTFMRKAIAQFTLSHAGSIRVLSLGLKKRLVREFSIKEDRMKLVPIYVDVSSLGFGSDITDAQKKEIEEQNIRFKQLYGERFNVVCVNRLVPIKNIPMQLQAIQELKDTFPHVLLHVVGDGPLQAALKAQVQEMKLEGHVLLHGAQFGASLSPFFSQSDCFVLTSDFEGYGMVIVEAATAGACIVMTDVGCAGEVIIHEESGLIVPVRDTQAFTEALKRVIQEPDLREKLKEGARRSIAELPTFDKVLDKYRASWEQALHNR